MMRKPQLLYSAVFTVGMSTDVTCGCGYQASGRFRDVMRVWQAHLQDGEDQK